MKSHSRRHHHPRSADPYPFDYALLSCLYIQEDGNDVLDFGGFSTHEPTEEEVQNHIRKSDLYIEHGSATKPGGKRSESVFLRIQGSEDDEENFPGAQREAGEGKLSSCFPKRSVPRLVSIEDAADHFWFMTQTSDGIAPFARMFSTVKGFLKFIKSREIKLPEFIRSQPKESPMSPFSIPARGGVASNEQSSMHFSSPLSPRSPLGTNSIAQPITKWIDIQTQPHNPESVIKLKQLLALFQIHKGVVDKCLYLSKQDSVDMSHLAPSKGGYMFFTISCTPLHAKLSPPPDFAAQGEGGSAAAEMEMEPIYKDDASPYKGDRAQESIMELRFKAVRRRLPRSCVPDPITIGVILFQDWILTIHNQPFAEMGDLLRVIQIQCARVSAAGGDNSPASPVARAALMTTPSPRRFTTSFVFSALFQICVGHNADSMVFAQAVDDLSDATFDVKVVEKKQGALLKYTTSTRLCFGECSADVIRRENVVAEILRNDGSRNFLLQEQSVRAQLINIQGYLHSLKNEICECHDTITMANWYTNISYYWILLRNGNRSLRMLLLLAEMVNVLTVVAIVQSIFSMNVRIPFDASADPPNKAKAPFYVLGGVLLIFMLWCVRIVWDIIFRKQFKTVALF